MLSAPVAPFFSDRLFRDLNSISGLRPVSSIHHTDWPQIEQNVIDTALEERMDIAQRCTSLVLSLRKKENLRVRQPLARILVPVLNPAMRDKLMAMKDLILSEVNVQELELVDPEKSDLVKSIKPDFKKLGPASASK